MFPSPLNFPCRHCLARRPPQHRFSMMSARDSHSTALSLTATQPTSSTTRNSLHKLPSSIHAPTNSQALESANKCSASRKTATTKTSPHSPSTRTPISPAATHHRRFRRPRRLILPRLSPLPRRPPSAATSSPVASLPTITSSTATCTFAAPTTRQSSAGTCA